MKKVFEGEIRLWKKYQPDADISVMLLTKIEINKINWITIFLKTNSKYIFAIDLLLFHCFSQKTVRRYINMHRKEQNIFLT